MKWRSLLLLLVAQAFSAVYAKQCDPAKIQECQVHTGMQGTLSAIGSQANVHYDVIIESHWLFNLTEIEALHYCDIWPLYETCLRDQVYAGCDDISRALIRGVDDATDAFCILARKPFYNATVQCLNDNEMQKRLGKCRRNFVNDTTGALLDKDKVCKQSDKKVRDCINEAVDEICGFLSFEWFHIFFSRGYKPIYQHYDCDSWSTSKVIIVNVVIGIFVVVIILGCTIFCYLRIRRSNRRALNSDLNVTSSVYYKMLGGARRPQTRRQSSSHATLQDASQPLEGDTELVSISHHKTLMSNQIL